MFLFDPFSHVLDTATTHSNIPQRVTVTDQRSEQRSNILMEQPSTSRQSQFQYGELFHTLCR